MSEKKEKAIDGASIPVSITTTVKNLSTILTDAGGQIHADADRIKIFFENDIADIVANYTHDNAFNLTATEGIPVARLDILSFDKLPDQFDSKIRSISGAIDAFVEQYELID
jgi:hypothetical protein